MITFSAVSSADTGLVPRSRTQKKATRMSGFSWHTLKSAGVLPSIFNALV
jgi:hypothetical protein